MKHHIQVKMLIAHCIVLLLSLLILGIYYWKFEIADFATEWENLRHQFQQQDRHFIDEINERRGKIDETRAFLYSYAQDQSMRISMYDRATGKSFTADSLSHNVFSVTLQDDQYTDEKHQYVFTFTHPVTWEMLRPLQVSSHILGVSVLLFCLSTIFLAIYSRKLAMLPLVTFYQKHSELFQTDMHRYSNEMQWEKIYTSLIQANETLSLEKRKQSAAMAAISHDLKTPLTSIKGYIERLMKGRVHSEERRQEYYQIIYRKATEIEKLTQDLSEYVQNDNHPLLVRKKVSLVTFTRSIASEYEEELPTFSAEISYSCSIEGNPFLFVDEQRIRRVFANIIHNSLNHAHTQSYVRISFRVYTENRKAVFELEDNGPGVPAEELPKIFEPFYRVDKARSKVKNGSGLGLAICKGMIEKQDGHIQAYLPAKGGLGIKIVLPIQEVE
ncbi:HAMP domain-containing sensor histidine kinase [Brevibacillus choshinensis]|uniref:sensor histidine kinase n=1 Tax=Brevibacillus choshinensis TaxID=54911 RepID=UPI002E1D839F|nr:HAMP domain-containing sensor histidine kinase [Brevibacillus choshinensis]